MDHDMSKLIGISGSLRRDSYNTALLRAAAARMPEGHTLRNVSIGDLPLFNADLEQQGMPDAVTQLKTEITQADGLLIATPEYNGSFPGVLKNALDWASRPAADIPRVFGGLPVAILGATPGPFATTAAQGALLPVLRSLRTVLYTDRQLRVPNARNVIDQSGMLTDTELESRLVAYVRGFCSFMEHVSLLRVDRGIA
jgi:chromate reductase